MRTSGKLESERPDDGVAAFFDGFVAAFATFDAARVAALYRLPVVAMQADGTVQCFATRADLERAFQAYLDGYRRDGASTCRWRDLDVAPIGGQAALATVTWDVLDAAGAQIRSWRESYNLVRTESGWRAMASIDHVP